VNGKVPLTLVFEKAGSIDVEMKVEAMGAGAPKH
jgi:periplasmic copper chaperone A